MVDQVKIHPCCKTLCISTLGCTLIRHTFLNIYNQICVAQNLLPLIQTYMFNGVIPMYSDYGSHEH